MSSDLQQETARTNGAQSHGPTTEEGKARSSQNATKHGLLSKCVVLTNESQQAYDELLASYRAEWLPQGQTENDILIEMVNARWRLRRVWSWETSVIDTEMFIQKPEFDAAYSDHHPAMRQVDGMTALTAGNPLSLSTLQRYESLYSRAFRRAMENLMKLQRTRDRRNVNPAPIAAETENSPNEPDPPAPVTPEPAANFDLPEAFHWQATFTPTKDRPTTRSADWNRAQRTAPEPKVA